MINPATGRVLATHRVDSDDAARAKVVKARGAFASWSELDPMVRGGYLQRFADVLRRHKDAYARTMTQEMGKPIRESLAEVEKCAWGAEFFAENAGKFLEPEVIPTDATRSYVAFHPRGVLVSIMPWNFPMWQIVRFSIPAIVAGNTTVVKPSSMSPQSGLHIEAAFREAGLPDGVFQIALGEIGRAHV